MDLHRRIRTLRLRRGLTGMEMARRAGVSASYISLIEHGEKTPSEGVAVRIARALGEQEDVYRVWAATARMDEATRAAVWRLREPAADAASAFVPDESSACEVGDHGWLDDLSEPGGRRPPGRPPRAAHREFPVAYALEDESAAPTLRIPVLAPGAAPDADPPPEDVEALVALDARLLHRATASGLVALRVDAENGRDVASWLRPQDLVVLERRPRVVDPALIHALRLPTGLQLARAALASGSLLVLPDPTHGGPPRVAPLADADALERLLYGTVIWSARLWRSR